MGGNKRSREDDGESQTHKASTCALSDLIAAVSNQTREQKQRVREDTETGPKVTGPVDARSTTDAVFFTTEPLENILGHLPMKDLLFAQRTCKKWRSVISSNKQLQRILFMIPGDALFEWNFEPDPRRLQRHRLHRMTCRWSPALLIWAPWT